MHFADGSEVKRDAYGHPDVCHYINQAKAMRSEAIRKLAVGAFARVSRQIKYLFSVQYVESGKESLHH